MLLPFVKPHQVLSYLVLAVAPGRESIAHDFKQVCDSYLVLAIAPWLQIYSTRFQASYRIFVSVTCSKWLQNYSISESGGAPKF